jgi:hypothetical protein
MKTIEEKVDEILEVSFLIDPTGNVFKDADKVFASMEKYINMILKEVDKKMKIHYLFTVKKLEKQYGREFTNELKNLLKHNDVLQATTTWLK